MSEYYALFDDDSNLERTKEYVSKFPSYMEGLYGYATSKYKSLTSLQYIRCFFFYLRWLSDFDERFKGKNPKEITQEDMNILRKKDITRFYEFVMKYGTVLSYRYEFNLATHASFKSTKKAVLMYDRSLNMVFGYLYDEDLIDFNPAYHALNGFEFEECEPTFVMDEEMLGRFMNAILTGEGLTEKQLKYYERTAIRDYAICCLLAGTGLRPTEICDLDVEDIKFASNEIQVHKVVKDMMRIRTYPLDERSREALKQYLSVRDNYFPVSYERALFLSARKNQNAPIGSRLKERAIGNMVHKYAKASLPDVYKRITPSALATCVWFSKDRILIDS